MLKRTAHILDISEAKKKIDELLSRLHAEGINEYDTDLNLLSKTINMTEQKKPTRPTPEPKQLSKMELNRLRRDVAMAIRKTGVTKRELQELLNKAHAAGVHDHDKDLNAAIGKAKN